MNVPAEDPRSLLVLLLLSLCNSYQRSLSLVLKGSVFPKADAKVLLFHEPTKYFQEKFSKNMHFRAILDLNQAKQTFAMTKKPKNCSKHHFCLPAKRMQRKWK